jgi:hypothetical protein
MGVDLILLDKELDGLKTTKRSFSKLSLAERARLIARASSRSATRNSVSKVLHAAVAEISQANRPGMR